MEIFNPTASDVRNYRQIIMQHGSGYDGDGYYVYSQEGEGIGTFFGNLMKNALPVIARTIKGATAIAKPHLEKAAKDFVTAGSKQIIGKISGNIANKSGKTTRKRRRRI